VPRSAAAWLQRATAALMLLLALAAPALYFTAELRFEMGGMHSVAVSRAYLLQQRIAAHPQMWRYEQHRMAQVVDHGLSDHDRGDRRSVRDAQGEALAQSRGPAPAWPWLLHSEELHDTGRVVGHFELERSLRPLLVRTAAVLLLSAGVSALLLWMLRLRALRAAEADLEFRAWHDSLTGLANRERFRQQVAGAVQQAARLGHGVAVLVLDLDQFRAVNDAEGHDVGDAVLCNVAQRLRRSVRTTDGVARLGGDEFGVLLQGLQSADDAQALAAGLVQRFTRPFAVAGRDHHLGCSVGVAVFPQDATEPDRLLAYAGTALLQAKRNGRNGHCSFSAQMHAHLALQRRQDADLRQALAAGQFLLDYQPLRDLGRRRTHGAEALLRWRHPSRGLVPPGEFIDALERLGLIHEVGDWVLHEACAQTVRWGTAGLGPLRVAVNVSPLQFARGPEFVATVRRALQHSGLAPQHLQLEVTEGQLMADNQRSLATLGELRALGVSLAIDDFGTGYSSLAYLSRFPVDTLKVDRSFVAALGRGEGAEDIVRAIMQLGHNLKLQVTAEGVETAAQLQGLQRLGCDFAQGFLLGRPMPAREFTDHLVADTADADALQS
jgi:diguanylate cyclase (GGDEF)-like protein